MRRLLPVILIAVLVCTVLAIHTQQDLLIEQIDQFLSREAVAPAVEEPGPIVLHESLELPSGPEGEPSAAITDIPTLARRITAGAATDYARLEAVYDWITASFAYDLAKLENMKNTSDFGFGAAYLLEEGKGVCHDFAELALALLTALDIEATYETGEVYPVPGKSELHAWNHVRVDGLWYAIDTTWGAGYIVEEENRFIQKPRRLYLTTPEELFRLHRDPEYKEEREQDYRRQMALQADPVYLSEYEQELLERMNSFRSANDLPRLLQEQRLLETARRYAARIADRAINDEEYSLNGLHSELERLAPSLRFSAAGMCAFLQWNYEPASPEQLFNQIVQEQKEYLVDKSFNAATVAVVCRGDLTVVVQIYLARF